MDRETADLEYRRIKSLDIDEYVEAVERLVESIQGAHDDNYESVLEDLEARFKENQVATRTLGTLPAAKYDLARADGQLERLQGLPPPELNPFERYPGLLPAALGDLLRAIPSGDSAFFDEPVPPLNLSWWQADWRIVRATDNFMRRTLRGETYFKLDAASQGREQRTMEFLPGAKSSADAVNADLASRTAWPDDDPRSVSRRELSFPASVRRQPEFAWFIANVPGWRESSFPEGPDFASAAYWHANQWAVKSRQGYQAPPPDAGVVAHPGMPADLIVTEVVSRVLHALCQPLRVRSGEGARSLSGIARSLSQAREAAEALGIDPRYVPRVATSAG